MYKEMESSLDFLKGSKKCELIEMSVTAESQKKKKKNCWLGVFLTPHLELACECQPTLLGSS